MNPSPPPQAPLDRLAIALSGICAVHCVLIVLAVGTIPLWGLAWLTAPGFHEWFLAIALVPSVLALWWGFRAHGDHRVLAAGVGAFGIMALAILLHEQGMISDNGESFLTLGGVSTLALVHWRNLRLRRRVHRAPSKS